MIKDKTKHWLELKASTEEINSWLRNKAYYYLSKREYGSKELGVKLKTNIMQVDELIPQIIEYMLSRNLISDERYAQQTATRITKKYSGKVAKSKIIANISSDNAEDILGNLIYDDEYTITEVYSKKFKSPPQDHKEYQKQMRFLISRGFSYELSKKTINQNFNQDE